MNATTSEAVPEPAGPGQAALLALSAGARAIGWAVFAQRELEATGRIVLPSAKRRVPADSANHLALTLDDLAARWHPQSVACCQAAGVGAPTPGLKLLARSLACWQGRGRFSWDSYTVREVRTAVEGRANASRDALAHAVMMALGLIGHTKTTQEWEAIAVGVYHLQRHPG